MVAIRMRDYTPCDSEFCRGSSDPGRAASITPGHAAHIELNTSIIVESIEINELCFMVMMLATRPSTWSLRCQAISWPLYKIVVQSLRHNSSLSFSFLPALSLLRNYVLYLLVVLTIE